MAIYGYGSGQTYATPQAAFDACQAANESGGAPQSFTEPHFIRGYGDAVYGGFASGQPVLRLCHSTTGRGVRPTQAFRLVIDRNGRDRVEFSDTEAIACIMGGSDDNTVVTNHVTIDLPGLHSSQVATGMAVVAVPGALTYGLNLAYDWEFKNADIYASQHSLVIGGLFGLRLSNVRFLGQNSGACLFSDNVDYGAFFGSLTMLNCAGRAEGKLLDLSIVNLCLSLLHCSLYSSAETLIQIVQNSQFAACLLLNSVLHTEGAGKYLISTDTADPLISVPVSNGNCFWYPGAGSHLFDFAGTPIDWLATTPNWKDLWGQDAHSLNLDPRLTDPAHGDFTPAQDSPCRMRGRAAAAAGIEGHERALSIDIGACQPSLAANWSLYAAGGEITANIQGRVPVRGL